MSDKRIVEVIAESLYGDPVLFHDSDPMTKTALRKQARGILGDLRAAGFDVYRPDDMTEEWWCLTHVLPGDRDLNDPDAMKRRCFAHRLNWDRPTWTRLKCRMVRRTVLVPAEPKESE